MKCFLSISVPVFLCRISNEPVWMIILGLFGLLLRIVCTSDDSSSTDVLLRQIFSVFASLTCAVMASPIKIVAICGIVFAFLTFALSVAAEPVLSLFGLEMIGPFARPRSATVSVLAVDSIVLAALAPLSADGLWVVLAYLGS